jgi:hypothetical protein
LDNADAAADASWALLPLLKVHNHHHHQITKLSHSINAIGPLLKVHNIK